MPRKTNTEKSDRRSSRGGRSTTETRTPRPKPKIDFTLDALDYKNVTLLRQFVTDQGRILPRKYTGLPAHYQRRITDRQQKVERQRPEQRHRADHRARELRPDVDQHQQHQGVGAGVCQPATALGMLLLLVAVVVILAVAAVGVWG